MGIAESAVAALVLLVLVLAGKCSDRHHHPAVDRTCSILEWGFARAATGVIMFFWPTAIVEDHTNTCYGYRKAKLLLSLRMVPFPCSVVSGEYIRRCCWWWSCILLTWALAVPCFWDAIP
jgi:hypothetical protein